MICYSHRCASKCISCCAASLTCPPTVSCSPHVTFACPICLNMQAQKYKPYQVPGKITKEHDTMQAYAALGNVMSLVGGLCSMCCSLLLPALFYLVSHRHDLTTLRKWVIGCVMASAVALLVLIAYQNFAALTGAHQASTGKCSDSASASHTLSGACIIAQCEIASSSKEQHPHVSQLTLVSGTILFVMSNAVLHMLSSFQCLAIA